MKLKKSLCVTTQCHYITVFKNRYAMTSHTIQKKVIIRFKTLDSLRIIVMRNTNY